MASVDTPAGKLEGADVEVAEIISDPVKMELARQALAAEGEAVEVSELLQASRGEVFAHVQRILASAGINVTFSIPKADEPAGVQVGLSDTPEAEAKVAKELSPEDAALTLSTLETRFKANAHLHKGCDWNRVKTALIANPEAHLSIAKMEAQGHVPDVYNFDEKGFDIGTCSEESPESARNCVYDAEAVEWMKKNRPDEEFNGSAVEMAEAMGIKLMSPVQYKEVLQRKGKFDKKTLSWLLTDEATRKAGVALFGNRGYGYVDVFQRCAHSRFDARAWRGSLRVLWT